MRKILFTVIMCAASLTAFTQRDTKSEKIKDLLLLMGSDKIAIQVANQMIDIFKESYREVDPGFWDEFQKEMKAEDLIDLIVPIYAKYYTEEEIEQLIKFYKTQLGKKVTETLPMITQESMAAGQIWGEGIGMKAVKKLRDKGYIKD